MDAFEASANVPRGDFEFDRRPATGQSFENALAKARAGDRLDVDDAVELLTTGTGVDGVDLGRKEQVLEAADRRRAEVVGEEVTFVANLNNNVTTACNTGCLFCNFKDRSERFLPAGEVAVDDSADRVLAEARPDLVGDVLDRRPRCDGELGAVRQRHDDVAHGDDKPRRRDKCLET